MKKVMLTVLSFVMIFNLYSCSKNNTVDTKQDETYEGNETTFDNQDEVEELSRQYANQMALGDFQEVVQKFTFNLKLQLNEKTLKKTWDATVAKLGDYVEIEKSSTETVKTSIRTNVYLKYEENGLKVQLVFNKKKEIEGLWINYYDLENEIILETNNTFKEMAIKIGDVTKPLNGILTLPINSEKVPVIILVHGSGPNDMDETVGKNKPFRDIARELAKRGIATIRYNKRFYQYPELATNEITIEAEVLEDVYSAIELAMGEVQLDQNKVFILGHSLGGMLAPKIAYENRNIAGIIIMAGSPRKLEDIILDQNKKFIQNMEDKSEKEKKELIARVVEELNIIKNVKEGDDYDIITVNSRYWYSLNQINTYEILDKMDDIPMLIQQGDKDFQVSIETDYKEWQILLEKRQNVTFHLYEGLNHLFMKTNGKNDSTDYEIEGMVDAKVINDIEAFIKKYQ